MQKPIIKKDKIGNEYKLSKDKIWVRNPNSKHNAKDINNFYHFSEYPLIINNININNKLNLPSIEKENKIIKKVIVISDGFNYPEFIKDIKFREDVTIIGVNGVMHNWNNKNKMDYYLCNNPSKESINFLNKYYKPNKIIASEKAYYEFVDVVKKSGITTYKYSPTSDEKFGLEYCKGFIDDYRNPICSAISIAYKLGCRKICLIGCDNSFKVDKPNSIKLENGLYTYSHHLFVSNIINEMFYWLDRNGVICGNASNGPKIENAKQIKIEELNDFFN